MSTAAERKAKQVAKENAAIAKLGGGRVRVLMYGKTMEALNDLAEHYGFNGKQYKAETVTHIIHTLHDIVITHKNEETTK